MQTHSLAWIHWLQEMGLITPRTHKLLQAFPHGKIFRRIFLFAVPLLVLGMRSSTRPPRSSTHVSSDFVWSSLPSRTATVDVPDIDSDVINETLRELTLVFSPSNGDSTAAKSHKKALGKSNKPAENT